MFDFLNSAADTVGSAAGAAAGAGASVLTDVATGVTGAAGAAGASIAGAGAAAGAAASAAPGAGQFLGDLGRGISQEGIMGLFDPQGMLDRQQAQRDLSEKFQVMPDDYTGPRTSNMVSQDQYQDIAHTYSDIRLGRADLKVDGSTSKNPTQYRADMMDDIGDIMQTQSGRSLIGQLSDNTNGVDGAGDPIHRTTTLQPLLDGAGNPNTSNAFESGNSAVGVGAPFANGTHGVGGNTTISANPNLNVVTPGGSTYRSDVALYHEMTHALHDTHGTTDRSTVQAHDGLTRAANAGNWGGMIDEALNPNPGNATDATAGIRRWEHQAVGLGLYRDNPISENRYRSERSDLAMSGQGLPGDLLMQQRDVYSGYTATHTPVWGL